jgi:hypothetical protein
MLSQTSGATVECTGRDVKDRIKKTRRRVADEVDDPPRLECTCPKPPDRPIYRARDSSSAGFCTLGTVNLSQKRALAAGIRSREKEK